MKTSEFEYDFGNDAYAECYSVVSTDDTGDIIVKLVNITGEAKAVAVNLGDAKVDTVADVQQMKGDDLNNDNILGAEEDCKIEEFTVDGISSQFNYTVPMYSVTVLRLHR